MNPKSEFFISMRQTLYTHNRKREDTHTHSDGMSSHGQSPVSTFFMSRVIDVVGRDRRQKRRGTQGEDEDL